MNYCHEHVNDAGDFGPPLYLFKYDYSKAVKQRLCVLFRKCFQVFFESLAIDEQRLLTEDLSRILSDYISLRIETSI